MLIWYIYLCRYFRTLDLKSEYRTSVVGVYSESCHRVCLSEAPSIGSIKRQICIDPCIDPQHSCRTAGSPADSPLSQGQQLGKSSISANNVILMMKMNVQGNLYVTYHMYICHISYIKVYKSSCENKTGPTRPASG